MRPMRPCGQFWTNFELRKKKSSHVTCRGKPYLEPKIVLLWIFNQSKTTEDLENVFDYSTTICKLSIRPMSELHSWRENRISERPRRSEQHWRIHREQIQQFKHKSQDHLRSSSRPRWETSSRPRWSSRRWILHSVRCNPSPSADARQNWLVSSGGAPASCPSASLSRSTASDDTACGMFQLFRQNFELEANLAGPIDYGHEDSLFYSRLF